MYTTVKGKNVDVRIWSDIETVEPGAIEQLKNVAALPWVYKHVAAMPDVHVGKGCTVGSVIAMKGAVSPAAVGVDIGCGMMAQRTNLLISDLPDSLAEIRTAIEAAVPVGKNSHPSVSDALYYFTRLDPFVGMFDREFNNLHESVAATSMAAAAQVGTLGGGNHFIELCYDEQGRIWIMLHSGSRNIGKRLAEVHIAAAKKLIHNQDIPDPDMAVFLSGTPEMQAYRRDLYWAQKYAWLNRLVMNRLITDVLKKAIPILRVTSKPIMCHHNYVAEEVHFGEEVFVTRKGAIRAGLGEMGIIPGSMGTSSYIVQGLGNPDSFESASHGAGRKMSRGAAKRFFTSEDLIKQTEGVECRKDDGVLDEIPGAYKDIDTVMKNQEDLVKIKHSLKQLLCVKG